MDFMNLWQFLVLHYVMTKNNGEFTKTGDILRYYKSVLNAAFEDDIPRSTFYDGIANLINGGFIEGEKTDEFPRKLKIKLTEKGRTYYQIILKEFQIYGRKK